jgi:hypothetical protein
MRDDATAQTPMASAILAFITERHGSVSFAQLCRHVPGFKGEGSLFVDRKDCSNVCLWTSISQPAADAISALQNTGAIHARDVHWFIYMLDGAVPEMPIAQRARHYKQPHWAPVVFHPGPARGLPAKRRMQCTSSTK